MGVFGFFRRHKDESIDEPQDAEDSSEADIGSDFKPAFREPISFPPVSPQSNASTDMQLVLARLELINQRLEVIDRRLQVIENIAKENK
ncbi:MAG TPA: hypothetical protein VJG30_00185 [Candidatus Nanoarchaeia archaeon]|nr:hypothetical protein [Candidatus Nanoarchaeia archaeon]